MTNETKKKGGHGGFRPGAGRPPGQRKTNKTFRLADDVLEILSSVQNKSEYVNEAIRFFGKNNKEKD